MLILTRKVGEQITIGNDIQIKVIEINGNNVRLGIEAPKTVSVLRREIYEKIQKENILSSESSASDIEEAAQLWEKNSLKESTRED